jgi:soluble lytic murein transglycosylase-like protein
MGEYAGKYAKEVNAAASKYNLDPKLIAAVIMAESNFNPKAGSGAGAKGLMQLMPDTFKAYGSGDIMNPKDNIMAGTRYLSIQIKTFGTVELGLAAYNAGPGAVKKYKGIPPYKETQDYVKKVMRYWGGASVVNSPGEDKPESSNPTTGGTNGNMVLDKVVKSPYLWVGLLVIFLIK